jgi:hypothetical protein
VVDLPTRQAAGIFYYWRVTARPMILRHHPGTAPMTLARFETHDVFNQSPPFEDVDLFALDRPLVDAVMANGGGGASAELSAFGSIWGSAAMAALARAAASSAAVPSVRSRLVCAKVRSKFLEKRTSARAVA